MDKICLKTKQVPFTQDMPHMREEEELAGYGACLTKSDAMTLAKWHCGAFGLGLEVQVLPWNKNNLGFHTDVMVWKI